MIWQIFLYAVLMRFSSMFALIIILLINELQIWEGCMGHYPVLVLRVGKVCLYELVSYITRHSCVSGLDHSWFSVSFLEQYQQKRERERRFPVHLRHFLENMFGEREVCHLKPSARCQCEECEVLRSQCWSTRTL